MCRETHRKPLPIKRDDAGWQPDLCNALFVQQDGADTTRSNGRHFLG